MRVRSHETFLTSMVYTRENPPADTLGSTENAEFAYRGTDRRSLMTQICAYKSADAPNKATNPVQFRQGAKKKRNAVPLLGPHLHPGDPSAP